MTTLLDSNVLIALLVADHVHHGRAETWFAEHSGPFATCPITQGAAVRLVVRQGGGTDQALRALHGLTARSMHRFWPDVLAYTEAAMTGVMGHRQVTDAYLAALARHYGGRLATFDLGLAALHADVATIVEV